MLFKSMFPNLQFAAMTVQLGCSQLCLDPKKCWTICPLPLASLTYLFPPRTKNDAALEVAQIWQRQSLPLSLTCSPSYPHSASLDLLSYEALPLSLCVHVCMCSTRSLAGIRYQVTFPGRLSGFQNLGCNQENGLDSPSVVDGESIQRI